MTATGENTTSAEAEPTVAPPVPGRTTVAPRALLRVVSAVTADLFGIAARAVRVDLSDRDGLLALRVQTPIRIVSLERIQETPASVATSGGTLLRRAAEGQRTIRERVTELTGAEIGHVIVELTDVDIHEEGRVR
jgi:hypothetical protein